MYSLLPRLLPTLIYLRQGDRRRADDYAISSGVVAAVLVPALLWNRSPLIDRT